MTRQRSIVDRVKSHPATLALASGLLSSYIWLVAATTRIEVVGREKTQALIAENKGVILAYWHQRLLLAPVLRRHTDRRIFQLSSNHRDAEIIANAVKPFGVEFIRGSAADPKKPRTNKGGAGAAAQMIAALEAGHLVAMTPDGPRGPARKAHPGILRLAQLTGAPILPGAYATSRGLFLKTWDRFLLALPFAKAVFIAGDEVRVSPDATPEMLEAALAQLETALNAATAAADRAVGRSPEADGVL